MPGNKAIIDAVARVVADPVDLVIHHTIENCTNWVPTSESTWPEAINKKGAIQRLVPGSKKLFFIALHYKTNLRCVLWFSCFVYTPQVFNVTHR